MDCVIKFGIDKSLSVTNYVFLYVAQLKHVCTSWVNWIRFDTDVDTTFVLDVRRVYFVSITETDYII